MIISIIMSKNNNRKLPILVKLSISRPCGLMFSITFLFSENYSMILILMDPVSITPSQVPVMIGLKNSKSKKAVNQKLPI